MAVKKPATPKKKPLTKKEITFVQQYCGEARFNGNKAATYAGYSAKTARYTASRLLTKINIQDAIENLMNKAAEKAAITVESLLIELDENRNTALEAEIPQAAAANSATMGKARLCGLDVKKVESLVKVHGADDSEW